MIKKERGNTLVLIIVATVIVLLLLAFFAFNYNQLMGGHKQVQSAIDAAALAAAVDISKVVVDTPLGRVALVDDAPAVASSAPSNNAVGSPLKSDAHPIQGINTIMGTLRLDAVIANKLGNNSMAFLIGQDIARAQEAAATLNAAIASACNGTGTVYDKFGNKINIFVVNDTSGQGDVQQAYNANKSTLIGGKNAVAGMVSLELGYVSGNVSSYTNVPLPSSEQVAGVTSYYSPYQTYQVLPLFANASTITPQFTGNNNMPKKIAGNFQFAAVAAQPALIDKGSWYGPSSGGAPNGSYAPATAVHVYVSQTATQMAKIHSSISLQMEAYAQAGGGAYSQLSYSGQGGNIFASLFGSEPAYAQQTSVNPLLTPSGTLEISFASGGIPGLSAAGQQTAPNYQKLQMSNQQGGTTINSTAGLFNNVASIMNATMADPATGSVESDAPWTPTTGSGGTTAHGTMVSPGNWFVTQGGAVPGAGGSLSPASTTNAAYSFKALSTTSNNNPSVALSYIVYDWLKTLGVRPSVQSVTNALTLTDPSLPPNSTFYSFESMLTGPNAMSVPAKYTMSTTTASSETNQSPLAGNFGNSGAGMVGSDWTPPAYAATGSGAPGIITSLEQFGYGNGAKDPRNLDNASPQDAQRQQQNVWGYVPADATISSTALLSKVSDGDPQTVDGHPIGDMYELWGALAVSAKVAEATKNHAGQIISAVLAQLEQQDQQFQTLNQQKIALQNQLQSSPKDSGLASQLANVDDQLNNISKADLPKAFKQAPRAYAALINAQYCMHVTGSIYSNFKALTGIGCQKISKTHYVLAGSDFWPVYQVASKAALQGTSAAPTGQDPSLSPSDWTTPPINNKSQLNFYKHASAPVVGQIRSRGSEWFAPAIALTTSAQNPYDNLHFCFFTGPGPSGNGAGQATVHLYIGPDPFTNNGGGGIGTLKGQALYQDTQALQTNPTTTTIPPTAAQIIAAVMNATSNVIEVPTSTTSTYTVWQVQARDQTANNYASDTANDTTSNAAATYFADMSNTSGASSESNENWCALNQGSTGTWKTPQCPALAAEWQLTCPMPATYNYVTETQYTLPPISYQELTATCDGNEGVGSSTFVLGNLASFSVGGVNISLFTANPNTSNWNDTWQNFQGQAAYNTNSGIHMVDFSNYGLYSQVANQGSLSAYMQALINAGRFNGQQSYIATFHS
jgi:hypothetical protein